jgi:hypothetical protein
MTQPYLTVQSLRILLIMFLSLLTIMVWIGIAVSIKRLSVGWQGRDSSLCSCVYTSSGFYSVHMSSRLLGKKLPVCVPTKYLHKKFWCKMCGGQLHTTCPLGKFHHTYWLAYLFTYLFTSWSRVVLEKLTGFQLVKFPTFYGTQRFITTFTRTCHLSLSWARSIKSLSPHPTS